MKKYSEERFVGERALFQSKDLQLEYCTFADGESPLKESKNLELDHCMFQWKYPLWYCDKVTVKDSSMFEMARAGIWYTKNLWMENMTIQAPKAFRRCENVTLTNTIMTDAKETLWNCKNVNLKDVSAKGDYFAMNCENMTIENFTLDGNYSFDGCKNITVKNAKMLSRDAFWNCENVTVYDSMISGEYLGWNSKNVTLIHCTIESEQGMCYMDHVVLKDCKLLNTNLAFEYSTVDAKINGKIDSIKNPISGKMEAEEIKEIIFDDNQIKRENTKIDVKASN